MAAAKKTAKTSNRSPKSAQSKSAKPARSKSTANTTSDHEEIRKWAEERQGAPACVRGTGKRGDVGMLRIDFPGGRGAQDKLQKISWDEWFQKFDERGLALLYQSQTASGRSSRFNKLVSRETAEAAGSRSGGRKTRTAGSSSE